MIRILEGNIINDDGYPWVVEVDIGKWRFSALCGSFKEAASDAADYCRIGDTEEAIELWIENEQIPYDTEENKLLALLKYS